MGQSGVQNVDAIVNAANSSLLGGGGVDGAIHRAGGPRILEACSAIRKSSHRDGLPAGEAVSTSAGDLEANTVVHTVGPIRRGNEAPDAETLGACYRNSLKVAADGCAKSIAFPAVATGVYGYPPELAAPVVSRTIEEWLAKDARIADVRLIFYTEREARIFIENQTFSS
jgi:O-acetyl-ADP-ribose deacetylase